MPKRGTVLGSAADGTLLVQYQSSGGGDIALPRPFVGSALTGLHSTPPQGAQVLQIEENAHNPRGAALISAADALGALAAQSLGETAIYGPRGDVLSYATASGQLVVYRNSANTLSIKVDPAIGRVLIAAAGGLWVNGQQLTVP